MIPILPPAGHSWKNCEAELIVRAKCLAQDLTPEQEAAITNLSQWSFPVWDGSCIHGATGLPDCTSTVNEPNCAAEIAVRDAARKARWMSSSLPAVAGRLEIIQGWVGMIMAGGIGPLNIGP
jgi:hypothetical protein